MTQSQKGSLKPSFQSLNTNQQNQANNAPAMKSQKLFRKSIKDNRVSYESQNKNHQSDEASSIVQMEDRDSQNTLNMYNDPIKTRKGLFTPISQNQMQQRRYTHQARNESDESMTSIRRIDSPHKTYKGSQTTSPRQVINLSESQNGDPHQIDYNSDDYCSSVSKASVSIASSQH